MADQLSFTKEMVQVILNMAVVQVQSCNKIELLANYI